MKALTSREIRHKLELMVLIIFLTRVISMIPVPGVDATIFKQWVAANSNDALNLFSAFTGACNARIRRRLFPQFHYNTARWYFPYYHPFPLLLPDSECWFWAPAL